jgi:hypothetical protein
MFAEGKCVQKLIPNIQNLSLTFVVSPSLKTNKYTSTKWKNENEYIFIVTNTLLIIFYEYPYIKENFKICHIDKLGRTSKLHIWMTLKQTTHFNYFKDLKNKPYNFHEKAHSETLILVIPNTLKNLQPSWRN